MVDQINNPKDVNTEQTLFQNNPVASSISDLAYGVLGGGKAYFPADLEKQKIWMSFSFYQYQRPQFNNTAKLSDLGTIRLPIPNNLVDTSSVEYTQERLGTVVGSALNALSGGAGAIDSGLTAAGAALGKAGLNLIDSQIVRNAITNQGGTVNPSQILGQQLGVALNPFMTVMFKQPNFKRHAFIWRLTPSNLEEVNIVNTIVKTFKFNQLPDMAASMAGTLLTYPNIVQVNVSNFNENSFSYALKPAVIESISVNYAPSSTPSFFGATKSPTEIEIRMTLLEITMWLQRDYGTPNGAGFNLANNTINAAQQIGGQISTGLSNLANTLFGS